MTHLLDRRWPRSPPPLSGMPASAQQQDARLPSKRRGSSPAASTSACRASAPPTTRASGPGLDVDYCKAIAAAVLGDASKVRFVPTTTKERFTALQSGEIDVLDAQHHLDVCARYRAGPELRRHQLLRRPGLHGEEGGQASNRPRNSAAPPSASRPAPRPSSTSPTSSAPTSCSTSRSCSRRLDEALKAYQADRCDAYTTDASGLYASRACRCAKPDDHVVLPDIISKEPLGPVVRQGDGQWFTIVKWVHFALLNAEEAGRHQGQRRPDARLRPTPTSSACSARKATSARASGSTTTGPYQIIKQVGNYGEIFERNVGAGSRLKIERGHRTICGPRAACSTRRRSADRGWRGRTHDRPAFAGA